MFFKKRKLHNKRRELAGLKARLAVTLKMLSECQDIPGVIVRDIQNMTTRIAELECDIEALQVAIAEAASRARSPGWTWH